MAHDEIAFPSGLDYGATGGPGYSTQIAKSNTSYEVRNQNWANPIRTYEVTAGEKSSADHETLLGFFNGRKGKMHSFNLIDPNDSTITNQSIGTGNGTAGPFQIIKTYADAVRSTNRTIKKPKQGTVTISVAGANKVEGVDYTIDYTTGLVTFLAGHFPSGGQSIKAVAATFYTPVRFDVDQAPVSVDPGNVYTWGSVPMREVPI